MQVNSINVHFYILKYILNVFYNINVSPVCLKRTISDSIQIRSFSIWQRVLKYCLVKQLMNGLVLLLKSIGLSHKFLVCVCECVEGEFVKTFKLYFLCSLVLKQEILLVFFHKDVLCASCRVVLLCLLFQCTLNYVNLEKNQLFQFKYNL